MKSKYFISQLKKAVDSKTLYVMGCFGAPMNATNKYRYTHNNSYNKRAERTAMINAATDDTFGFDCVCLIKGVLWGWDAKVNATYGGAVYASNGVPDVDADDMILKCKDNTTGNWNKIQPGEVVWKEGHIGVYVGDGKVIESTPIWNNCVQYSNLANIGYTSGHSRTWTKHGHLPYVDYSDQDEVVDDPPYIVSVSGQIKTTKARAEAIQQVVASYGFACSIREDATDELKIGDKVKMLKGAPVYGKSYGFSSWVYDTVLYVRAISGACITVSTQTSGAITGRVDRKYLTKL